MECTLIDYYTEVPGECFGAIEFYGGEIYLVVKDENAHFTTEKPVKSTVLAPFEIPLDKLSRVRFLLDTEKSTLAAFQDAQSHLRDLRAAIHRRR